MAQTLSPLGRQALTSFTTGLTCGVPVCETNTFTAVETQIPENREEGKAETMKGWNLKTDNSHFYSLLNYQLHELFQQQKFLEWFHLAADVIFCSHQAVHCWWQMSFAIAAGSLASLKALIDASVFSALETSSPGCWGGPISNLSSHFQALWKSRLFCIDHTKGVGRSFQDRL